MKHKKGRPVHGLLLLDKPAGISSNKALQTVKRLYQARKAGHTGSLDPLATGMLPLCFGEATKISAFLLDADKGYEVTMKLGETTDSADSDGELLRKREIPPYLDEAEFTRICDGFTGALQQIPPMVSAIKVDGQRLYKLARKGVTVDRAARSVTIHSLQVRSFSGEYAQLTVHCSKGTYIRSLVSDIGEAIGCGAHVTALRRSFVSPFEQRPLIEMSALQTMTDKLDELSVDNEMPAWSALDALLLPLDAALEHLPAVRLCPGEEALFANGQQSAVEHHQLEVKPSSGFYRVYSDAGLLLGLGEMQSYAGSTASGKSYQVAPRRVFQWN